MFRLLPLCLVLLSTFASTAFGLCQVKPTPNAKENRPNLIVILADDLGYRDVGCYGCQDFKTPNLDSLANQGVRCTSGYVTHPYCSPSRAGILSGMYQQHFGHEHNPPYDENDNNIGIDKKTVLLPKVLAENGYQTGLIGKWHLGAGKPFRPSERGFKEFYGFLGGGHDYFRIDYQYQRKARVNSYLSAMWHNGQPTKDSITYITDDLTDKGLEFIEKNKSNPFCLLMMYNAPHAPDHVKPEHMKALAHIKNPGRRKYAALVKSLDENVGRITKKIESLQLEKKTLVVFLSDNGGRRGVSDNRPLRGNKGWLNEGGIRVPFILSMPGTLPEGKVIDQPIVAFDLLPTLLAQAKISVPKRCHGKDIFPYLSGEEKTSPHRQIFWRVSGGDGFAVRKGNWKIVHDIGMKQPKLYDLSKDVGENADLSKAHPKIFSELLTDYHRWSGQQEKPRWTEGHTKNSLFERKKAQEQGTRQFPMGWIEQ